MTTAGSRSNLENASNAGSKLLAGCTSPKRKINRRPEDRLNEKVIDEEYRRSVETLMKGIADLPKNWDEMTVREQRDWHTNEWSRNHPKTPKSLVFLCTGVAQIRQCERSPDDPRPEWLDHEKFLRGQRFALKHWASVSFSELLSLYVLFSFENGLKPMIVTGKSSDPFSSFKRYLSTSERIKNWYSSDPWTKGTPAYKDMVAVRRMHSIVREGLIKMSLDEIDEASTIKNPWTKTREILREDFRESCPVPEVGQCPFVFSKDEQFKRPKGLNQGDMAATQGGFVGLVILFPEYLGIHGYSQEDLDAYCHLWRSLGYLLGIEDEYNFCRGSLKEVQQRMRDFLDFWVKPNLRDITPEWEHMLRCILEGVTYYFPGATYEQSLLYLTYMLDINVPRLKANTSYRSWYRFQMMKFTFYWTARFPGFTVTMNSLLKKCVDRALSYTEEELEIFRQKSKRALAMNTKETIVESSRKDELMVLKLWHKASPIIVFLSTCLLLNFSIVKELTTKMYVDILAQNG